MSILDRLQILEVFFPDCTRPTSVSSSILIPNIRNNIGTGTTFLQGKVIRQLLLTGCRMSCNFMENIYIFLRDGCRPYVEIYLCHDLILSTFHDSDQMRHYCIMD